MDADGRRVTFPHAGPSGIKQLSPAIGITPVLTLKPGDVVSQGLGIWSGLTIDDLPAPGRYTARVVCSYHRFPDGEACQIEAAPIKMTITEQHIQEWKRIEAAPSLLPEERVFVPGPVAAQNGLDP